MFLSFFLQILAMDAEKRGAEVIVTFNEIYRESPLVLSSVEQTFVILFRYNPNEGMFSTLMGPQVK